MMETGEAVEPIKSYNGLRRPWEETMESKKERRLKKKQSEKPFRTQSSTKRARTGKGAQNRKERRSA